MDPADRRGSGTMAFEFRCPGLVEVQEALDQVGARLEELEVSVLEGQAALHTQGVAVGQRVRGLEAALRRGPTVDVATQTDPVLVSGAAGPEEARAVEARGACSPRVSSGGLGAWSSPLVVAEDRDRAVQDFLLRERERRSLSPEEEEHPLRAVERPALRARSPSGARARGRSVERVREQLRSPPPIVRLPSREREVQRRSPPANVRHLSREGEARSSSPPDEPGRQPREERERRFRNKLCLYCGQADHFLLRCPVRPVRSRY